MKKTVLIVAGLMVGASLQAQTGEITSNRGENWLSESGDYGFTIDAMPFIGYVGDLFNGTANNNIGSGWTYPNRMFAIQGKKLKDSNTAYRGKLRLGFGGTSGTELVSEVHNPDITNPDTSATVEDLTKTGYSAIVVGVGLEKRVGSSRVVGVYGAEFNVAFGSGKTTYEYGNALSDFNQENGDPRPTEVKSGSTIGVGLGLFGGVEWFFAPKMSLSGEYTWGFMLNSTGIGTTSWEMWDSTANNDNGAILSFETEGNSSSEDADKTSSWSIDTGVSGASLGLNFYFQ